MSNEVYSTGEGDEDENERLMDRLYQAQPTSTVHDGITLKSTVKDGFRVDTITIRIDYPMDEAPSPYDYRRRLDELFKAGQAACDDYNRYLGIDPGPKVGVLA